MGGLYEYIKMAVQNIRANKGRSFLTTVSYTHLDVYKRQRQEGGCFRYWRYRLKQE